MLKLKHLEGALRHEELLERAAWKAANGVAPNAEAMTHEASRYCHGDDAWTDWQPCTAEQAARYERDDAFKVRPLKTPNASLTGPAGLPDGSG